MIEPKEIILILASYALGCFTTGYYWVRYRTGRDIREFGSTAAGARNVSRELGVSGFATTLVGDFLKGVFTVLVASYFELKLGVILLAIHAVVIGHIWPVQLGFRGGKGIATALGGFVLLDPKLTAALLLLAAVGFALSKKLTLSGILAVILSPAIAAMMNRKPIVVLALTTLAIVILFAHRKNLHDLWTRFKGRQLVTVKRGHL